MTFYRLKTIIFESPPPSYTLVYLLFLIHSAQSLDLFSLLYQS